MFVSLAVLVTVSRASSLTVWLAMLGGVGGMLTSLTTTVKLVVSWSGGELLSATDTIIVLVDGLCIWLGVQLMRPMLVLIVIPVGAEVREKASVLGGT